MDSQKLVRGLLIRGLLAGLAAGVLMFAFAWVFGEPQVDAAIRFEEAASPPSSEAPLVSRDVQSTFGLLTGTIVFAVAVGGIFALVFAAVQGRIGHARPRCASAATPSSASGPGTACSSPSAATSSWWRSRRC